MRRTIACTCEVWTCDGCAATQKVYDPTDSNGWRSVDIGACLDFCPECMKKLAEVAENLPHAHAFVSGEKLDIDNLHTGTIEVKVPEGVPRIALDLEVVPSGRSRIGFRFIDLPPTQHGTTQEVALCFEHGKLSADSDGSLV